MQSAGTRRLALAAVVALVCGVVTACSSPPSSAPAMDPTFGDLDVSNATTLPVTIVVNGSVVTTVIAGSDGHVAKAALPPMPWAIEARSPSGRLLLSLMARAENVTRTSAPNGGVSMSGAGDRVDLSCGRLDVWVGPPMIGPAPGSGTPGDCAP